MGTKLNLTQSGPQTDESTVRRTQATLESIDSLTQALAEDAKFSELDYDLPADFLLSIVVPIYNERYTIAQVIRSLFALPLPVEVIAIDDGSTDGSIAELTRLNGVYPELRVSIQEMNQGKGAALRRGFHLAQGTHVMVQDADLEYDPTDIPRLVEPLAKGEADVVFGSRFLERRWHGSSTLHRLGNRVLTTLSNWMTGLRLTDMETCYKVLRRDLLDDVTLQQNRFGFEVELTSKLARKKAKIVERPISYTARGWAEGKKIGWRDGVQALYCIARYR